MIKIFKLFWILLFLTGIVVPLFRINTSEITEQENRTLAKFPQILKKGKFNRDCGKEFESWLGDRFWGRDELINARFKTLYKINGKIENEKAFIGDDGWMFQKSETVNILSLEKQQKKIEKEAKILKEFADKFKNKNIPIYLVLLPNREELYQKYWERYFLPKPKLNYALEITRLLKDTSITVIDPKQEFEVALKKQEVFYKDDSHITSFGRNILLNKLYTVFSQKELQNLSIKPISKNKIEKRKHVAITAADLGLPGKIEIEEKIYSLGYPNSHYEEIEATEFLRVAKDLWNPSDILYRSGEVKNAVIEKKLISLGPCYSRDIFDLFKPLFRYSEWIRTNQAESYGKEAKQFLLRKINDLFILQKNSAVIIITQDSFDYIKAALEQFSAHSKKFPK